jgi:hypothetical protein
MTPLTLPFDHTPRRKVQDVRDTSLAAYECVLTQKARRCKETLQALIELERTHGTATAGEVMAWIGTSDPNRVRPRISEMKSEEMRLVEECEKRVCRVKGGKPVYTYRATERGKMFLESKQ